MDYTKVISTVKKYVFAIADMLEKLNRAIIQGTDAIKTDVAGVKTDVATVKTDVAGVKSDTETNIPQKIDAGTQEIKTELKSTTEQIKSRIVESTAHVANEETLPRPRRKIKSGNSGGAERKVVDVSGKGYLNYALASGSGTMRVILDGHAFVFPFATNTDSNFSGFLNRHEIIATSTDPLDNPILFSENCDLQLDSGNHRDISFLDREDYVAGKTYNAKSLVLGNGKIQFNKHLEVYCISETSTCTADCFVSYELA